MPLWEFEREGELVRVDPTGPLVVRVNAGDLAVAAAIAGTGIIYHFEDWLHPGRVGEMARDLPDLVASAFDLAIGARSSI